MDLPDLPPDTKAATVSALITALVVQMLVWWRASRVAKTKDDTIERSQLIRARLDEQIGMVKALDTAWERQEVLQKDNDDLRSQLHTLALEKQRRDIEYHALTNEVTILRAKVDKRNDGNL